MSTITASDILPTNLLSELNLNPMWEKIRGYSSAASIAVSLYTFYVTLNGVDVHCVPVHNSSTSKKQSRNCTGIADGKLSYPQIAYVNSQCATDKVLTLQRHAGAIMLGISIVILLVSSFWLHIRKVKDGIRTFSSARDKFLKLDLSRDEAIKFCSKPLKGIKSDHVCTEEAKENLKALMKEAHYNAKAHKTVREVIRLFAYHRPEKYMFAMYMIRNIVLVLVSSLTVICLIWILTHTEQWSKNFKCTTNVRSGISSDKFICTSKYGPTIIVYLVVYCGTVMLQALMIIRATIVCYPKGYFHSHSKASCVEEYHRSPGLLISFWESATPSHTGLFKAVVTYIHSSEFEVQLYKNMENICKNEDHELIRIKSKLFEDTSEVISALYKILCTCPGGNLRIKMSINAVKSARYSMNDNVCQDIKKFILKMKEEKMVSNELIVNMVKNWNDADVHNLSRVKESINLNDIENISRSGNSKRSILYYAFAKKSLSGPHEFAAAKALCQGKNETDLSIHEKTVNKRKTEISLRQYLKEIYLEHNEVDKILIKCEIAISNTSTNQQRVSVASSSSASLNPQETAPKVFYYADTSIDQQHQETAPKEPWQPVNKI